MGIYWVKDELFSAHNILYLLNVKKKKKKKLYFRANVFGSKGSIEKYMKIKFVET